jgi:hypothetical protein
MLAARANKLSVVEYLIRAGADSKRSTKLNQSVYTFGNKKDVAASIERGLKYRLAAAKARKQQKTKQKPVITWSEEDVSVWLKSVCSSTIPWIWLEQYIKNFKDNMINGDMLLDIDDTDLVELEVLSLAVLSVSIYLISCVHSIGPQ